MIGVDLLMIVLIAAGLVIFIGEPLVRREAPPPLGSAQEHEVEQLTLQKETLYTAIYDLDFDYHTGKVDRQDYTALRQDLEGEAIETLRALDAVDPLAALDSEIEQRIAALRQSASGDREGETQTMCPRCETVLQGDENFCAACGEPLRAG